MPTLTTTVNLDLEVTISYEEVPPGEGETGPGFDGCSAYIVSIKHVTAEGIGILSVAAPLRRTILDLAEDAIYDHIREGS